MKIALIVSRLYFMNQFEIKQYVHSFHHTKFGGNNESRHTFYDDFHQQDVEPSSRCTRAQQGQDYVSDAGIKIPGITSKHDDDAKKIDAKIAMKKAAMEKQKRERLSKDEELKQRQKERGARKAELEKARGFETSSSSSGGAGDGGWGNGSFGT